MRYWSVLSGSASDDNNHFFDLVEELSVIGVGWHGVGNVRGLDFATIRTKVIESHPHSREGRVAGVLDNFANKMEIGDIVLTRKPHERKVLIGQITGDYTFNDSPEREILSHTREVEWLRTDISFDEYSDAFRANGKTPAWGQQTVWNADPYAGEIDRLLDVTTEANDDAPALVDDGSDAEGGFRFGRERELQVALSENLQQLDSGLKLSGVEHSTPAGRADIVATDSEGSIVVIELKAGRAEPDSIAQLLAYMGTIENPEGRPIRGILVANDFHTRVQYAAKAVPNVDLRSYSYKVSFGDVGNEE